MAIAGAWSPFKAAAVAKPAPERVRQGVIYGVSQILGYRGTCKGGGVIQGFYKDIGRGTVLGAPIRLQYIGVYIKVPLIEENYHRILGVPGFFRTLGFIGHMILSGDSNIDPKMRPRTVTCDSGVWDQPQSYKLNLVGFRAPLPLDTISNQDYEYSHPLEQVMGSVLAGFKVEGA